MASSQQQAWLAVQLERVQASLRVLDFDAASDHQTLQQVLLSLTVCRFLREWEQWLPQGPKRAEKPFDADCAASVRLDGSPGGAGFPGRP